MRITRSRERFAVSAGIILLLWLLLGALSFFWTMQAHAQGTATVNCTPPTTNIDGSALLAAQKPLSFKFREGTVSGTYPNISTPQAACSFVWQGLSAGTHFFVVTAIDKLGAESAFSNAASKLVAGAPPNPPVVPQPVSVAGPVFAVQTTDDALIILEVGSVVAGKPCDPTQAIAQAGKTYMLIPKANVTGLPGQQLTAVFGSCL